MKWSFGKVPIRGSPRSYCTLWMDAIEMRQIKKETSNMSVQTKAYEVYHGSVRGIK